ncbi:MAG: tetratricopeptide repeat protein, partial [Candidatus Poribacteria bacterium]|nr:tetratricopeptide repeat protein [Candidatus Poribacteria bacterium]
DEAIRINPDDAIAYHNRGLAKSKLGHLEGAISDYNEALRIDPNNAKARANREDAQRELREREKET